MECDVVFLSRLTSVRLGDDVGHGSVRSEGEVEDVGGVVLPRQRVEHLAVDSHLDVFPLSVAHLEHTVTHTWAG